MEKIKFNDKRYFLFGIISSIIIFMTYCFFSQTFNWITPILLLLLSFLLSKFILFKDSYVKNNGVYFSHDGLYGYNKGKLISKITWEDLQFYEKQSFLQSKKSIYLKIYSKENLTNPFNILVDWFFEESALEITKKYVPKEHALYKKIQSYAENKKLKF